MFRALLLLIFCSAVQASFYTASCCSWELGAWAVHCSRFSPARCSTSPVTLVARACCACRDPTC